MQRIVDRYMEAKETEKQAKESRIQVEAELISAINNTKMEGSKSVLILPFKISVITSLKRTIDQDIYNNYIWPSDCKFLKLIPGIDLAILRVAEGRYPTRVAECITTKPMKPSIKIKEVI